ncbi:hypothetical protein Droror1_Dr00023717 [Drosera rotundifolia]
MNPPMEKPSKPKNKLFKYLPRAATAMSFRNPVFSPGRDKHRSSMKQNIGFSGPMIPDVARRKPKNVTASFDVVAHELTSPKVGCMGQIKLKKKKKDVIVIRTKLPRTKSVTVQDHDRRGKDKDSKKKKTNDSKSHKISKKSKDDEKWSRGRGNKAGIEVAAPSLGKMKKYASGRDTLGDFDWMAPIKEVNQGDHDLDYHSFEVGGRRRSESYSSDVDEEEEVIIPHSAPILLSGQGVAAPERKQINLWARRTMASPSPLQL